MIFGSHVLLYAKDAARVRAFLRDVLGLSPHVDAGQGWLIFALPPAEIGIHPDARSGKAELYVLCDDLRATMAELAAKGVEFTRPASVASFGTHTSLRLPGGGEIGLYQPKHPLALRRAPARRAARPARSRKASRPRAPSERPAAGRRRRYI